LIRKIIFILAFAGLPSWLCSCSPRLPAQRNSQSSQNADLSRSQLDFRLVNFSGIPLNAIYISPSQSPGWEENIIDGTRLEDGDSIKIRFSQEEQTTLWDLRVVGVNDRQADWKGLALKDITTLKLRLKAGTEVLAVLEAE